MTDVSLTIADGIGILRLDRTHKRNALSRAMLAAIPGKLEEAAADPAVRVLVLTGGAGRDFSVGADIDEFEEIYASAAAASHFTTLFSAAQNAVAAFPKPSVAMISGACIGGGCGLALGCDLRITDDQARFGITPAKLGLAYSLADTKRVTDALGYAVAADLLFSGRIIAAAEALRIGLVSQMVAADALEDTVIQWAGRVAANASSSVTAIKAMIGRIRSGATQDDAVTRAIFEAAFSHADFAEGRAAFAGKRPPRFPGAPLADQ